jgi:hypothetical protein
MKEFIKRKRAGFYFALITLMISLFSFGSYLAAANDSYGYNGILIFLYLGAVATTVVFLIKDFGDVGAIVTGILYGAVFGMFIKERFVYFATALLGISQDGLNPKMLLALVAMLMAILINILGAFLAREKYNAG